MTTGSDQTRLILPRGNSASGTSSLAAHLRQRFGSGPAIVAQGNPRRIVLRERDVPGGADIGLIDSVARYALDAGCHTVVEGVPNEMFARLGELVSEVLTARTEHQVMFEDRDPAAVAPHVQVAEAIRSGDAGRADG